MVILIIPNLTVNIVRMRNCLGIMGLPLNTDADLNNSLPASQYWVNGVFLLILMEILIIPYLPMNIGRMINTLGILGVSTLTDGHL